MIVDWLYRCRVQEGPASPRVGLIVDRGLHSQGPGLVNRALIKRDNWSRANFISFRFGETALVLVTANDEERRDGEADQRRGLWVRHRSQSRHAFSDPGRRAHLSRSSLFLFAIKIEAFYLSLISYGRWNHGEGARRTEVARDKHPNTWKDLPVLILGIAIRQVRFTFIVSLMSSLFLLKLLPCYCCGLKLFLGFYALKFPPWGRSVCNSASYVPWKILQE